MSKAVKKAWTRWLVGTAAWAIGSCLVVALIWGPDPFWLAATGLISIAISWFLGNSFRS